jgi:glycosyltransferase involved in cell wall biosynthesis
MRIVAVSWRDTAHRQAGGAELVLDRLLSGLASRGHQVTLVCGGPVASHAYDVLDAGGTYGQYLRAPHLCRKLVRDADVLVDVQNGVPFFSPLWWPKPSLCLVHHIHTDQWETRFPRPVAAVLKEVERRVMPVVYRRTRYSAVSTSTLEGLVDIGVRREAISVIESGVDIPPGPLPPKAERPLFLSVNRLVPHKRIELLLRAWAITGAGLPGGRLVIAGDGPELAALRRQAASIPGAEILGRISEDQKQDLLASAWAVVTTAHHEGWGMSIMEAAAAGTPALSVDVPGVRDAIVDGTTGVLLRPAFEAEIPDAMAKAILEFSTDVERRETLGLNARERAKEFTWSRTMDRWECLLEEVAFSGSGPAAPVVGGRQGTTTPWGK